MAFVRVCNVAQLEPAGMAAFYVEGVEVLVLRDRAGALHAFDGICPHQDSPLGEGYFDGAVITCATHGWMFDAVTGQGINPSSCRIAAYPLKLEGDEIYVDLDGEVSPPPKESCANKPA
jgi:toluene monooxygenase system ferredoxin subunit